MITEGNKITAGPGKILRRISDGFIYGNEVYLGYTYYLGGELLPEPLLELPEHFEEIDESVEFLYTEFLNSVIDGNGTEV